MTAFIDEQFLELGFDVFYDPLGVVGWNYFIFFAVEEDDGYVQLDLSCEIYIERIVLIANFTLQNALECRLDIV